MKLTTNHIDQADYQIIVQVLAAINSHQPAGETPLSLRDYVTVCVKQMTNSLLQQSAKDIKELEAAAAAGEITSDSK